MPPLIMRPASVAAALLALTAGASAACYPATDDAPLESELVIQGTGGTYWDKFEAIVAGPFEAECGVDVTFTVTPNRNLNELRALIRRGGSPWDLVTINTPWDLQIGTTEGLFEALPEGFWDPVADSLAPGAFNEYGYWNNAYANVIIYSTSEFSEAPSGWADFWDTEKFPGPRALQDSPTNIIAALIADGLSPDEIYPIDDEKLARAFAKLDELRPEIRAFWTAGDAPVQGVAKGDFVMSSAYNGRAFNGIAAGYDIAIQWNENILSTVWGVIPAKAQHPKAAQALMVFLNRPEIQKQMAIETGYTSAIAAPETLVEPDVAANLATSTEHVAKAIQLDGAWWTDNIARVQSLWREWVTTGSVSL
ncbi:ABC transporter substrate-binding protein [Acuticoccus kandeliae]|uniref:ABC transporter substrate-binding protein n=1 Tax=Acuticoccus kandeliae TaxID=2073160 RepID=UPI000D3E24C4|nr:extracellular solute-binding protein [Acuticoccus kandeliae]